MLLCSVYRESASVWHGDSKQLYLPHRHLWVYGCLHEGTQEGDGCSHLGTAQSEEDQVRASDQITS